MSSVITKLNSTKDIVRNLLERWQHYRDDDNKIISHIWRTELMLLDKDAKKISAYDFLVMYAKGELTPADYITRARRKIQEQNPELRGSKWKERHEEEKEVRQNINK